VLHDTKPGGIGICYAIHELVDLILNSAHNMVQDCTCHAGCPSCVHDWHCGMCGDIVVLLLLTPFLTGEHNQRIDKQGALLILKVLIPSFLIPCMA
jgi:ATP-dependent helicase YprA (DUF1998 family)